METSYLVMVVAQIVALSHFSIALQDPRNLQLAHLNAVTGTEFPQKRAMMATTGQRMAVLPPAQLNLVLNVLEEVQFSRQSAPPFVVMVSRHLLKNVMTETVSRMMVVTVVAKLNLDFSARGRRCQL